MICHTNYIQDSKREYESDLPSVPNQGFRNLSKMEICRLPKKKKAKKIIGAFLYRTSP